ncbi:hypothetical protein D3C78_1608630 [compost metagenome]
MLFTTDIGVLGNDPVEGTQALGKISNRDAGQQCEAHGVQIGRAHRFSDSQAETGIAAGLHRSGVESRDSRVVDADQGIGGGGQ